MHVSHAGNSEVSILNRILRPNAPTFSPEAAQDILALDFDQADKERMRQLSAKARAGTLTAEEDAEAGKYELVGHLLNIMQSKCTSPSWSSAHCLWVPGPRNLLGSKHFRIMTDAVGSH